MSECPGCGLRQLGRSALGSGDAARTPNVLAEEPRKLAVGAARKRMSHAGDLSIGRRLVLERPLDVANEVHVERFAPAPRRQAGPCAWLRPAGVGHACGLLAHP